MNTLSKKQIPLLDLRAQYATLREEAESAVAGLMQSRNSSWAKNVGLLEREIADYGRTDHAVACAWGSDAVLPKRR
jgi:dTDP-4-amino-4,6-dideoxygalactose transaminase